MDLSWITGALGWIPLLPLIGFSVNILLGRKFKHGAVHAIAVASVAGSFLLSLAGFFYLRSLAPEARIVTQDLWQWMALGGHGLPTLDVHVAFTLDPLSSVMLLVVTGVGLLIHIYSIGYMHGDDGSWRFFAYLNLFSFAMLVLVLAENLLLMFVGWEGVGLCSYLLIGFWFTHLPNTTAGNKAFIVNRIGDFGFLIGMLLLFWGLSDAGAATLSFGGIREAVHLLQGKELLGLGLLNWIGICLFIGATGKSAQIPLYVWLPDAMAGPTPVSALIHAATMVTAGVYMMARLSSLYVLAPVALLVVATVGGLTALFSASIGLAQNDIKKVLAYSTVSQLGYMVLAIGTAAFSAGIFHLMTHAFFKACLFLGSGSVILSMHHEQDMRKMGGLAKVMPVTFATFLISTVAIAGIPPFAGFFSKDEILWKAFEAGGWYRFLWLLGLIGAILTAFYMFRLVAMTFLGTNRADKHTREHLKEQPLVVTAPLMVLALLATVGGFVGVPHALGGSNNFHAWLAPVIAERPAEAMQHAALPTLVAPAVAQEPEHAGADDAHGQAGEQTMPVEPGHRQQGDAEELESVHEEAAAAAESMYGDHEAHAATEHAGEHGGGHSEPVNPMEYVLMAVSVLLAALSGLSALYIYTKRPELPARAAARFATLYRLLLNKYFVDEFYQRTVINGVLRLMKSFATFDRVIVDGIVNGMAWLTRGASVFSGWVDKTFVDGLVNGAAAVCKDAGAGLRRLQNGRIQNYAYVVITGVLVLVIAGVLIGIPR
ncbi:MAG: NADH-quinone oxidoreductase subunit L [Candidatus Krumholzibacteriia bacterium]|nr:NADH-quinone oxidoreductase subunit L [bacterium]